VQSEDKIAGTGTSHVVENTPRRAADGRKLTDMQVIQSTKLANVCYEIRGPVLEEAMRLEAAGHRILKLNTGNPAAFGFECPPEILEDVLRNVSSAHGYGDAKGLLAARRAVVMHNQTLGIETDVEHVFIGNGVSELIVMAMQALLDDGDEVLVPAPDYPLWTAAVSLSGGTAVHYRCDEQSDWMPDLADIERKVTDRTKALVVINPNNPTGAVYDEAMIRGLTDIARRHNLLICSDEIYDKILYDGATHTPTASIAPDLLTLTFNGMSKAYRVAGYRVGWMSISGPRAHDVVRACVTPWPGEPREDGDPQGVPVGHLGERVDRVDGPPERRDGAARAGDVRHVEREHVRAHRPVHRDRPADVEDGAELQRVVTRLAQRALACHREQPGDRVGLGQREVDEEERVVVAEGVAALVRAMQAHRDLHAHPVQRRVPRQQPQGC